MTVEASRLLAEAVALRRSLDASYEEIRDRALTRVGRWEWDALGTWREIPVPFWAELHELPPKPSRPTETPPKRLSRAVRYGLDETGAAIVAQSFMNGADVTDELFIEAAGDWIMLAAYRHDWSGGPVSPGYAAIASLEGERVVEWARSANDAVFETLRLDYDADGRVATVRTSVRDPGDPEPATFSRSLLYTRDGQLDRIHTVEGLGYQAPGDGSALVAVPDRLSSVVLAAAAADAPDEPLFAFVILYDYATLLPPTFGFIPSEAADDPEHQGPDPDFWNPAEHLFVSEPSYEISGDLGELLGRANAELREAGSDEALRTAALDIARALQLADWPDSVIRSDGFVVMAVDAGLLDVERNLADLLGPHRLEDLKRRGLI